VIVPVVLVVVAGLVVMAAALRLALGRGVVGIVVAAGAIGVLLLLAVSLGGVDQGGSERADPVDPPPEAAPDPGFVPLRSAQVRLTATSPDALPPVPRALGDLEPGAVLVVRLSGLEEGSTATVHQCRAGAPEANGCRAGTVVNLNDLGSATVLVDLEPEFEVRFGTEVVDCGREACSLVVFGSSRLELVTVFGRPAPPPARVEADPSALPPGARLTATATGLEPGTRAAFLVCRPGGEANADCGAATPYQLVGRDGRVSGEVTVTPGRCPRGATCAVAVVVGDGGPVAFTQLALLGRGGVTYDTTRLAIGVGIAVVLLLVALWLLRHTDWTPVEGDPFAGVEVAEDPFGPDVAV
jgi:hypothetical protein